MTISERIKLRRTNTRRTNVGKTNIRRTNITYGHTGRRREVLRYLGYRGQEADGAVAAMVEQSMAELWEAATPRHLYREYPCHWGRDYRIDGGCFEARSRNLWGNLKDCDQIIVFAATLGCGADHLIQKYSRLQMSRAVVMQAAAAAMIEEYCDQVYRDKVGI